MITSLLITKGRCLGVPMPLLKKPEGSNAIRAIMSARPEINFGGGWGNCKAPERLRMCFEDVVRNNFHAASRYSKTKGNENFLEVLVDRLEDGVYGRKGITLKNIISGNGSTELASCLFKVLLQRGDAVLLTDPCYVNYPAQATVECGEITIKRIPVLDEKLNFLPATNAERFLKEFELAIEMAKPRIVLIATPDNPTSQVWPSEVVEKMCEITLKYNVWFLMDLAYRSIHFGKRPQYYSLSLNDYENLITIQSFSKDFSLLGLRAAYVIAREDVIAQLECLEGTRSLSPTTLVQLSLLKFFETSTPQELDGHFQENRQKYLKASRVMVDAIRGALPNPTLLIPTGGFYLVLKIAEYGFADDVGLAGRLLEHENTAVVPGSAFGKTLTGSLRLSYAPLVEQPDMIEEGIRRLARELRKNG